MRRLSVVVLGVLLTSAIVQAQPQPWHERAKLALIRMLQGPGGVTVAQSVQRITHPTGSDANLQNYDIQHVGDGISVKLYVTWSGGLGAAHTTTVAWDFDRRRHRSAAILGDNAAFAASEKAARQLDTYFRDELYPVLRQNMGE